MEVPVLNAQVVAKVSSRSEFARRFKCLGGDNTIFARVFALPVLLPSLFHKQSL